MLTRAKARLRAHALMRPLRSSLRAARPHLPPIIYIGGILGTQIYDRAGQRFTWGSAKGLLRHDWDPLGFAPGSPHHHRALLNKQLHEFNIVPGLISSVITRDVLNALEVGLGYREHVDLFFLGYDWRDDYRRLGARIENEIQRLRLQFGQDQQVILIGQSVANLGLRHWLRQASPDFRAAVRKWYAFGPPWLGTWNAVHMLQEGCWPASKLVNGFSAEAVARCPSSWQLLPAESRLCDRHGNLVAGFDIFDANHWADNGLPSHIPNLQKWLDMGRTFAREVSGTQASDAEVPQTWFANDRNLAVTRAVQGQAGSPALTTVQAIRKKAPDAMQSATERGDDHLPLRHLTDRACGPLVRDLDAMPWGHNAVLIGQAHDHRAQINHAPNLQALAQDIAALSKTPSPRNQGPKT